MDNANRNSSFYLKRITGFILLLALSAVFLFSAGAKLWVIQPFEWSFIDILPVGITAAGIISRLFIGLEIMIGLFLPAHIFLKRFTYKATLVLLVLLTLYLILLLIKTGNNGSCGCFGEAYEMKPLTAVWKNIAMIAATVALMFLYPVKPYKNQWIVTALLVTCSFTAPFIIQPVYLTEASRKVHIPVDLEPVYTHGTPPPATDLKKGKHIIAFFSLTCPHCKRAAYLMQLLHRQYPDLPFYAVLGGSKKNIAPFFKETQAVNLPYTYMEDGLAFMKLAGDAVPAIYWINDSVIEKKTFYGELEPDAIKKWLQQ